LAGAMALLVLFQIYLGALVAGLDAGMAYNTWPLMDGSVVPGDLFVQQPWWINLFENPKTVQFVHRLGAYLVLAVAVGHAVAASRADPGTTHARRAVLLLLMIVAQAALGITALLLVVPFGWALLHHGFAVAHWRGTVGEYPRPVPRGT
jgi:cytochrome c oxidase assembly protein subunit 15